MSATGAGMERPATDAGKMDRRAAVVLGALMLNTFMSMLDQSIVATAGPTIVGELGGLDRYAWLVTGYMLTFSVTMPLYGKLGDQFGRKPVHLVAIAVFLTGSVACGLAQSMGQLIASRVWQGIGGGGLVVLGMGTLGDLYEPRRRARYQGYFALVFTLANLAGPVLGGVISNGPGWRWVFFVNAPLAVLTATLLLSYLTVRQPTRRPRIDYSGALALSASVTLGLLICTWGGQRYDWTSAPLLGMAAAAVLGFGTWLWLETRAEEPIVPLRLFRDRGFAISGVVALIGGFGFFGCITFVPLLFQLVSGADATQTGLLYLPAMVCVALASILAGQVIGRTGRYKWFPVASLAAIIAGVILLATCDTDTPIGLAATYLAVVGLGSGLSQQVTTLAAQNCAPPQDLGVATSTVGFLRNTGVSVGAAVFGAVLSARLDVELPHRLPAGAEVDTAALTHDQVAQLALGVRTAVATAYAAALSTAFTAILPLLMLGFVTALFLPDTPLRRRGPGRP